MQRESVSDKLFITANNRINRIYYGTFMKKILSKKPSLFLVIVLIVSTYLVIHKPIAKFLIVSDPFHMRRVSMIFKKVFKGTPVSLTFSPAGDSEFPLGGLWSPSKTRYILSEYVKIVYYMIRY